MSESEQVIPAKPGPSADDATISDRRFRIIGFSIILIVFFGFGTWAAVAPISSAAHAPGKIRVESKRQTVQHLEGGIVKTLPVRDGDYVEKGQIVMTLDDTQARSQHEVIQGQSFIALAREARLIAQRDQLDEIAFPQLLLDRQEDKRVREAMKVQQQIFEVRKACLLYTSDAADDLA